jgi:peptidoglycan L-alanyl-D-glutamate endopeptidase CwlK
MNSLDKVTIERIAKLHPSVRAEATEIISKCNKALTGRAQVRVAQGYRSNAEQDALFNQRPKVTNAKGGQSIHNYGFAIDIVLIIDGKTASWETNKDWDDDKKSDWMEVVTIFKANGWNWGGDWTSFKDMPHFEKKGFGDWKTLSKLKKDSNGYVIIN